MPKPSLSLKRQGQRLLGVTFEENLLTWEYKILSSTFKQSILHPLVAVVQSSDLQFL